MNLKQKIAPSLILATLLYGCGSSNSPISADTESVNKAKIMRDLYAKSNGNYDTLTPSEKEQFQKVIVPGMPVEKAWALLAPQKANR